MNDTCNASQIVMPADGNMEGPHGAQQSILPLYVLLAPPLPTCRRTKPPQPVKAGQVLVTHQGFVHVEVTAKRLHDAQQIR